jgi:hypothetical protein
MITLPSAGVLGLVATPTVPPADPADHARQITASLPELESAHSSPCTSVGVDMRKDAMRAARLLITASVFSCLFIGIALASVVITRSFSVAHAQLSRSAPAR